MAMKMIAVDGNLKSSLDNRIRAAKDPGSNLAWTTTRMPWMRFTSNVLIGGAVSTWQSLSGGAGTLESLYDTTKRGLPTPGLVSATIKHTGTLKTLKKVEVSYKCYTLEHLNLLEKLFMSLGKTVVLEYGWSVNSMGKPVTQLMSAAQMSLPFGKFVEQANVYSANSLGCYAADKGVVSNFKWNQDSDGAYNCTTTFASPAEMMMSATSKKMSDTTTCKTEDGDEAKSKKETDVSRKLQQILKSEVIKVGDWNTKNGKPYGFAMRMDKEQSEAEQEANTGMSYLKSMFGASSIMTPQKFVTWAWFEEDCVNDGLLPKTDGTGASSGFTLSPLASSAWMNSTNMPYRFDSRATQLHNPVHFTSADPTVCMIPGQPFWGLATTTEAVSSKVDFDSMQGLLQMSPFAVSGDARKGWLSHVCINARFLARCASESETVGELVNKVLDGINGACGNHWDLVFTPLEANPAIMTVVDTNALGSHVAPYSLSIYGNNSICREVTIDTEISNAVKAQIMYGSNKKGNAKGDADFSLFGKGLTDRTTGWGELDDTVSEPCVDAATAEKTDGNPKQKMLDGYEDAWYDLMNGVDPDTIGAMKSAVSALQLFTSGEAEVKPQNPPLLPVNFSFKTDGIGGFKWGHSLMISPIPARYSGCSFMVTGIDHNISADSWDTSISTVLRIPPGDQTE
jgi:hypothetical protein